ncbi:MAG: dihydroorotate dehydrogenase-like protein [Pseudomonadota bacterium]|nr:dihydroorotate dehydrogenase-like protein [Pseudomonadota bacterium]
MADLTTTYCGLTLRSPLVPSSSPLTGNLDDARRLEDAGAAALILPSLFEEELIHEQEHLHRFVDLQDIGHHEADSFLPTAHALASKLDHTLETIDRYKQSLAIPVIGSLNGVTDSGWIEYARDLQAAGCDALEINLYGVNADCSDSSADIEARYQHLVRELVNGVSVPVVVKLSSQFTGVAHFVAGLEQAGAAGVSLFNRFYQPDIDLETLEIKPCLSLSGPQEALLRIRWLAMLRPQVQLTLAATGGFHDGPTVLKALLAGADVVHLCSVLLQQGIGAIGAIESAMAQWLEEQEYDSVKQLQGSLSYGKAVNPGAYERANYLEVLDSYTPSRGVRV